MGLCISSKNNCILVQAGKEQRLKHMKRNKLVEKSALNLLLGELEAPSEPQN